MNSRCKTSRQVPHQIRRANDALGNLQMENATLPLSPWNKLASLSQILRISTFSSWSSYWITDVLYPISPEKKKKINKKKSFFADSARCEISDSCPTGQWPLEFALAWLKCTPKLATQISTVDALWGFIGTRKISMVRGGYLWMLVRLLNTLGIVCNVCI